MQQRPLPNNIEAEKAVLGSCIVKSEVLYEIADILAPEDFYLERHQKLYKVMLTLLDDEGVFDLVILSEKLKTEKFFEKIGGVKYLAELVDAVSSAKNASYYAKVVKKKADLRKLYKLFYTSAKDALDETDDPSEIALKVENGFFNLITVSESEKAGKVGDFYDEFTERLGDISVKGNENNIPSGYEELDNLMYGFAPSEFVVIAGRPGMGKTQFFLNLMKHIAIDNRIPVLFFSIEMSKFQIFKRLSAILSKTPLRDISQGAIRNFAELEKDLEVLRDAPLYIDDTPGLSIFDLRLRTKRFVAQSGIKIVFIDHMQLITGGRGDRYHKMTEFSGALKGLAKELDIPVIVASQLSRGVEQRGDKTPILSDLRESGAIEQDADKVLFLHREDYYSKEKRKSTVVDLKVLLSKHRDGGTGDATFVFDKNTGIIYEPITGFGNPYMEV